ncbi:hypothetical protein QFZ21_003723 [Microbacterium sp. W4I20]|nr:hypothetical protein [Microbacterium sp. W4I20]
MSELSQNCDEIATARRRAGDNHWIRSFHDHLTRC